MENGDTLSGEILRLEGGKLTLKTLYAGVITLEWRYVQTIDSDKTFWVSFIGEEQATKRKFKGQGSMLSVIDENGRERTFSAVWPVAGISRRKPVIPDTWQITGNVGAGLDGQKGNENDLSLSFDGQLNIDDLWNKNSLKWDIDIENDDGVKTTEWILGYSYSRYLDEHWFIQGAADQKYDSGETLRARTAIGSSLGYRFWEKLDGALKTSGGLTRLREDYREEGLNNDFALNWELSYRKKILDNLNYSLNNKLFYRLGTANTLIIDTRQSFIVGLTEQLALKMTHLLDYDSHPGSSSKKLDNQIKFGIDYQW